MCLVLRVKEVVGLLIGELILLSNTCLSELVEAYFWKQSYCYGLVTKQIAKGLFPLLEFGKREWSILPL